MYVAILKVDYCTSEYIHECIAIYLSRKGDKSQLKK